MSRSHNIDIEAERRTLIDLIKEADLSEAMVRKVRSVLTKPEPKDLPPMPCQMTIDEVAQRLRKQVANPSKGVSHDEVIKIASQW